MDIQLGSTKEEVFSEVAKFLESENLKVINQDISRPWGGFFVIDEGQAEAFIAKFFSHLTLEDFKGFEKLSPKILIVGPEKRLSWQYHNRRAEIWKLIHGVAGVVISDTDQENPPIPLSVGQVINLKCGERHRLIGTDGWGIVAEIWQHTDKDNPSDEDDIIRVQDDFGR